MPSSATRNIPGRRAPVVTVTNHLLPLLVTAALVTAPLLDPTPPPAIATDEQKYFHFTP